MNGTIKHLVVINLDHKPSRLWVRRAQYIRDYETPHTNTVIRQAYAGVESAYGLVTPVSICIIKCLQEFELTIKLDLGNHVTREISCFSFNLYTYVGV